MCTQDINSNKSKYSLGNLPISKYREVLSRDNPELFSRTLAPNEALNALRHIFNVANGETGTHFSG